MKMLPGENQGSGQNKAAANPFAETQLAEAIMDPSKRWVVTSSEKQEYDNRFYSLALENGKASGTQVREVMLQSGLQNQTLRRVWELVDITKTGTLDSEEFALCCWLLEYVKG